MVQTTDGGYALAGIFDVYHYYTSELIKTDSAGNQQWSKIYDGGVYSMVQASDGGYALAGSFYHYGPEGGYSNLWLLKTDSAGNQQWSKEYEVTSDEWVYSVIQTSDGGYALAGGGLLVKTDSSGNLLWSKNCTGSTTCIVETSDGGYVLAGGKDGDLWLAKISAGARIVVPDDYPTIQEAINAAGPGDTIHVKAGVYEEHLVVNKSISLIGEDPSSTEIFWRNIHAPEHSAMTLLNVDGLNLTGFKIYTHWPPSPSVEIINCSNINIVNCTITVSAYRSSVSGVTVTNSKNLTFTNCEIKGSYDPAIIFENSHNNTITNSELSGTTDGSYSGALTLINSSQNIFFENSIQSHDPPSSYSSINPAVGMKNSMNNIFYRNNILAGYTEVENLIIIMNNCSYNLFHHNNMLTPWRVILPVVSDSNQWDDGTEGNYWEQFEGQDLDNDGILDSPFVMNNGNKDNYPLSGPFSKFDVQREELTYHVTAISNSTVTDFDYAPELISFNVTGEDGTAGFCRIMFPRLLIEEEPYEVLVDGHSIPYDVLPLSNSTHAFLYFTYIHSSHNIVVKGVPTRPRVSFTFEPSEPVVNQIVTFDASASFDPDGSIISYGWDFGDGTTITEADPVATHIYKTAVAHSVNLTLTDNDSLTDFTTQSINVGKMPASISILTDSPSTFVGYKVNITGTLQDIFGNGLGSETVVLYYAPSGTTMWTPITSDITDTLGKYFAIWIPPATGYFTLKAEWAGNATHLGTSNTATLSSLVYGDQYVFSVESNSTISELAFDTKNWKLSFVATGPDGTTGYTKVTVAKSLVAYASDIRVFMDGRQLEYSVISMDDSWFLNFNYVHSTHQVEIDLGTEEINSTPPTILVLSPENETFYPENNITLTFTVDEPTDWMGYSLDGQENVTITGNTTLTSLFDGSHYVVVCANDTVGNMATSSKVSFAVDTTHPNITDVSQIPLGDNVQPEDEVIVNATVVDVVGGVERVALNYTNGNGTWVIIEMTSLSVQANVWSAIIPAFPYGTNVTYIVIAEDAAGNTVTSEELGYDTQYQVVPEFPPFLILLLFMMATLLAVMVCRRKNSQRARGITL